MIPPDAERVQEQVGYSTDHPHGPEDPRWIDDEGRCVLCGRDHYEAETARLADALAAAEREARELRKALDEALDFALEAGQHATARNDDRIAHQADACRRRWHDVLTAAREREMT